MNGRLRRIQIPPSSYNNHQQEHEHHQHEEEVISLIPFTLPNGIITTHQITLEDEEGEEGGELIGANDNATDDPNVKATNNSIDNCDDNKEKYKEIPFMLHHLKEVHRMKQNTGIIIDHCWTFINHYERNSNSHVDRNGEDNNNSNSSGNKCGGKCSLVLAILTRLGEKEEGPKAKGNRNKEGNENKYTDENENENSTICSVFLYSKHISIPEREREQIPNPNEIDINTDIINNPSSSCRIDVSYFVNNITMDDNILVIGSFIGATIYDIHDCLKCNIDNDIGIENEDNNDDNNNVETEPFSIRIMKSCIVQAMTLSYPYFAVASGDRVGIWQIDHIVNYIQEQKEKQKHQEIQNDTIKDKLGHEHKYKNNKDVQSKPLVAIWNTKVNNCHSRITCIEMTRRSGPITTNATVDAGVDNGMGDLLALSCWDGSAFVFQRNNNNNAGEELWTRIIPKKNDINNDCAQGHTHTQLKSWEDPSVDSSDIVFPTFVTLCSIQQDAHMDTNHKVVRRIMTVSCPGTSIVRCYDIDSREWYKDIGLSLDDTNTSRQVHGMVNVSTHTHKCTRTQTSSLIKSEETVHLIWVDEKDILHEYQWR
jgi:hypothetical protein